MRQSLTITRTEDEETGRSNYHVVTTEGMTLVDALYLVSIGFTTLLHPNPQDDPSKGMKRAIEHRHEEDDFVEVVWRQRVVGGGIEAIVTSSLDPNTNPKAIRHMCVLLNAALEHYVTSFMEQQRAIAAAAQSRVIRQ